MILKLGLLKLFQKMSVFKVQLLNLRWACHCFLYLRKYFPDDSRWLWEATLVNMIMGHNFGLKKIVNPFGLKQSVSVLIQPFL